MPAERVDVLLTLAVCDGTPWKSVLERTGPDTVGAIFDGLTALYWVSSAAIPSLAQNSAPTKQLLTDLLVLRRASAEQRLDSSRPDHISTYDAVAQLRVFMAMWSASRGDEVRSTRLVRDALYQDAAERLDTITYPVHAFGPSLSLAVQQLHGLSPELAEQSGPYRALTRHFTDSPEAPPVTILSPGLEQILGIMSARYERILRLPDCPQAFGAQDVMRSILGDSSRRGLSVRDLLLTVRDPAERQQMLDDIGQELLALTNPDFVSQLSKREKREDAAGSVAVRVSVTEEAPTPKVDLWEVIKAFQDGKTDMQTALDAIYRATYSGVYRTIRMRGVDPDTAEDLAADLYIRRLMAKLPTLEDRGVDLRAWLNTVASNIATDHLRSAVHNRNQLTDEIELFEMLTQDRARADNQTSPTWNDPFEAVLQHTEYGALRAVISEALDSLDPTHAQSIRMRYFDELSNEQIANKLSRSVVAVKTLLFRARANLRQVLAERYTDKLAELDMPHTVREDGESLEDDVTEE